MLQTGKALMVADESDLLSGPLATSVDITNKCNAKCLHCFNRSGGVLKRDEMSDTEFLHLIEDLAEIKPHNFCFCGGEPMLRFELLVRAARLLSEAGVRFVSMVSNGWYIDGEKAAMLVDAGVTNVQISLDGSDAATHERMRGVPGLFDRAVAALGNLNKVGMPLQIAFSPTRFNVHQFEDVIDLALSFEQMTEIRVQPLMPMGNAIENEAELFPTEEDYRRIVSLVNDKKADQSIKAAIQWGDPLDHLVRFPFIDFNNSSFLDIKSDGGIAVSAYLPIRIGNVRRHSIKEYWKAGIGKMWRVPVVQELASQIVSIDDMKFEIEGIPTTFFDENIEIDFIDQDVMNNLDKFTLDTLVKGGLDD